MAQNVTEMIVFIFAAHEVQGADKGITLSSEYGARRQTQRS